MNELTCNSLHTNHEYNPLHTTLASVTWINSMDNFKLVADILVFDWVRVLTFLDQL